MLSYDNIARVSVSASPPAPAPDAFSTGLILFPVSAGFSEEKRLKTYNSAADMLSDGFEPAGEAYQAAVKYFAAAPAPPRVLVSCYPSGESPAAAYAAVLDRTAAFYGVCCCEHTPARMQALGEAVAEAQKPAVLFYAVTGTVADAVASGSLFHVFKVAANGRACGLYAAAYTDAAALMGLAMGLDLVHTASAFALCYKSLNGVQPVSLTESEVTSLKNVNANVYVTRGYDHLLLENGTAASGRRYDEVLYQDRIANDLQAAAVRLLAENTGRLPQTDDTSAQFISVFSTVLAGYAAMGVLATAPWRGAAVGPIGVRDTVENGFALWAEPYDEQTDADRQAHKAMPVHAALCFAGSVESVVITVNVTA